MALIREWIPSPNYSYGVTPRLIVIHTTEGFTGANGMYDLAHYFSGNVGASSHVGIDAFHPGHIVEMVKPGNKAWTQCGYNGSTAAAVEQCAYASWSRDIWLNQKEPLLRNVAAWIAEEAARWGIPITRLSASQAQGSGKGVCGHSDLGPNGCGHSDPGSGYPWDVVLEWARGGTTPTPKPPETQPEEDEDEMPYVTIVPKADRDMSIDMSLNGGHSTMGICADMSVYETSIHVRAAFHLISGPWHVVNVYADDGHQKVVVRPPEKFDGVNLRRMDDVTCDIIANFGK